MESNNILKSLEFKVFFHLFSLTAKSIYKNQQNIQKINDFEYFAPENEKIKFYCFNQSEMWKSEAFFIPQSLLTLRNRSGYKRSVFTFIFYGNNFEFTIHDNKIYHVFSSKVFLDPHEYKIYNRGDRIQDINKFYKLPNLQKEYPFYNELQNFIKNFEYCNIGGYFRILNFKCISLNYFFDLIQETNTYTVSQPLTSSQIINGNKCLKNIITQILS